MNSTELIKDYLRESKVMQIATVDAGQPWICTVYFVEDDQQNLYWLSLPTRRHSRELADNGRVAVAVPVKTDMPVVGIQMEGMTAQVIDADAVRTVMERYVAKYGLGKDFYDNFVSGKNQHQMYQFIPDEIVLFDEVHFAGDPRQTVRAKL